MKKVLVLVDVQNDFIDGSLGTAEAQAVVPKIVEKINNHEDKGNTIILFTKDTHYDWYEQTFEGKRLPVRHCIENTPGWSINREIESAVRNNRFLTYSSGEIINSRVYKHTFGSKTLQDWLVHISPIVDEIEFIGLCTDICVISNALMARMTLPDTKITVDASCCAGSTPEKHIAALEVMKSCLIDVINE